MDCASENFHFYILLDYLPLLHYSFAQTLERRSMESNHPAWKLAWAVVREMNQYYTNYLSALAVRKVDCEAKSKLQQSVVPGLYEHWKSTPDDPKFYMVTGVGLKQQMVQAVEVYYTALYGENAGEPTSRWLLDHGDGFLIPVERKDDIHDYVGPRFVLVRELDYHQICVLLNPQLVNILSKVRNGEAFKALVEDFLGE